MSESMRDYNVVVCIPSGDMVHADFAMNLASLLHYCASTRFHDDVGMQGVSAINVRTSILPSGREMLVEEALRVDATHVLFLDSDMKFPRDLVHRLVAHDRMVVGCNYARKSIPSLPTAVKLDGELCYSDEHLEGLEEVNHLGFGAVLIDTEVLKELEQPLFLTTWNEEGKTHSGEDIYFFEKVAKAGYPVYVDHSLSHNIGHVGCFNFTHAVMGESIKEFIGDEEETDARI